MGALTVVILIFSAIAAIDYVMGNRFGLGTEYERGFMLLGTMALSMIGMIVLSPLIAELLAPAFSFVYDVLGLDPSIIPASLFANDMGGASLSVEVAKNESIGLFNALVVSSMMGCTVSFTIPFALGVVKKENHRQMILGLLCGVVTIPIGCFVGGLLCPIPIGALLLNVLPLALFSALIAVGLIFFPNACIKIFNVFGFFIKALIITGLTLGIVNFLAKREVVSGLATIEEGALVCLNASVVMTGMFPLINIVSRLLSKPLNFLGGKLGVNDKSVLGLVSSLATSATSFGMMDKMDGKGIMLNSAFAVSGAFTFASHIAFTMAFDASYILPVTVGKLTAGLLSIVVACLIGGKLSRREEKKTDNA